MLCICFVYLVLNEIRQSEIFLLCWCFLFSVPLRFTSSANSASDYDVVRDLLQRELHAPKYFNFAQDVVGAWAAKKVSS